MISREQYLDQCSIDQSIHQRYYAQFVDDCVKQLVSDSIGMKTLLKSGVWPFNDIPLKIWDRLSNGIPSRIAFRLEKCGDAASQSTYVCILKEAARQLLNQGK